MSSQPPTPPSRDLPDVPFEGGSIGEYFYKRFPADLARIEVIKPGLLAMESAVFFGGSGWGNVRGDLARISKGNRERCVLSLFMVTMTEQVIYTYHRDCYEAWRSRTAFPKFGWSGLGFHHENPFILLQRPVDEEIVTAEKLCSLIPEFTHFYLQATQECFMVHLPQIQMGRFLRVLMNDHDYVQAGGRVALEFKRCLEVEVQR